MSLSWNDIVPNCVTPEGVATLSCIPAVFKLLINAALMFAGVFAVFLIVHSGFKFVISSADPKRVEDARHTLVFAIVGLIIILFAFFLVNLVSYITGVACIKLFGFEVCK